MKLTAIISIAILIVVAIIIVKSNFKIAYKVTVNGEKLGYVENKDSFTCMISNNVLNQNNENIELVTLSKVPEYSISIIGKGKKTDENSIISILKLKADITYKLYAITLNGEDKAYVNTMDEAKAKVSELSEKYKENSEFGIREVYTENMIEYKNMKYATITKLEKNLENKVTEKQNKQGKKEAQKTTEKQKNEVTKGANVNGIILSVAPVSGRISSRFGVNESVRNHTHMGLDIAASNGTPIIAPADGVVTYAQYNSGGYGNLVKISHGNGVETYYGHCSKLFVSVGQSVKAGDTIAAVGSTGHSTGNHLHFEIRINGSQVNPQKYLYK